MGNSSTWPEQEVINAWLREHRVPVTHQDALALKDAVTRIRTQQVALVEARNKELTDRWDRLTKEAARQRDLVPEHYLVMASNLRTAHEINGVLTDQRDAAEGRFVRIRAENDDLQDALKRAETLERVAKVKIVNLRADLDALNLRSLILGILAVAATVSLILVLCHA